MLISQIQKAPSTSYDYMERLVNDGSPSGFTQVHNTSKGTNPLYCEEFTVKKLYLAKKGQIITRGKCGINDIVSLDEQFIYIHPDLLNLYKNPTYSNILSFCNIEDGLTVIPTSSSRTVRVKGTNRFLKLHYPGVIGRLQRDLGELHLSFAVEITKVLNEAKQNGNMPYFFDFMPEYYGRVGKTNNFEIGFLCREMPLYNDSKCYIPAFSLFSSDHQNPNDDMLLVQLLQNHSDSPLSFLLNDICFPLIDSFFYCVFDLGLIPEMHSQNVVFLFNNEWRTKKVLLRDFESMDVDFSIREGLGLKDIEPCPNNKKLRVEKEYYLKRHSFMFDHKLCEYLIDPLVKCAASTGIKEDNIIKFIKRYCIDKYGKQFRGFFPKDNRWYKYPNEEIDRSTSLRPYISMGLAKYR